MRREKRDKEENVMTEAEVGVMRFLGLKVVEGNHMPRKADDL